MSYKAPLPVSAKNLVGSLLDSGDLFRYERQTHSEVYKLESEVSSRLGGVYALATSSCTSAMFLALKALALPPSAKVVIPAFTFAAVPSAVIQAGLTPVLCEITSDYRIDIGALERLLQTRPIACMLISHMRGHVANLDALMDLSERYGVPLVEDAAHALGATWNGRPVGTIGRMGCYSFQSYKLLNSGEGGMLVTREPDLVARAVIMSGAYEESWRKHPVVGAPCEVWQRRLPSFNVRMSNLAAALLISQVAQIPDRSTQAQFAYGVFEECLGACPGIQLPKASPQERRAPDSFQFNLPTASSETCRALLADLKDLGLKAEIFGLSEGNARAFWNWDFLPVNEEMPETRRIISRAFDIRLPIYSDEAVLRAMAESISKCITSSMTPRKIPVAAPNLAVADTA